MKHCIFKTKRKLYWCHFANQDSFDSFKFLVEKMTERYSRLSYDSLCTMFLDHYPHCYTGADDRYPSIEISFGGYWKQPFCVRQRKSECAESILDSIKILGYRETK